MSIVTHSMFVCGRVLFYLPILTDSATGIEMGLSVKREILKGFVRRRL
jgi:hypothetical protein